MLPMGDVFMAESPMKLSNVRIAASRLAMIAIMGSVLACGQSGTDLDTRDEAQGERYAITNVDVVPMDTDTVRTGQTVLVESGRISAISSADTTEIPAGYEEINGTDKYLAPGLADMHAHPMTQYDLDVYLASGVTFIRAMWGEPVVLEFRDSVAAGTRVGPRIMAGGRIVDGDPVIHYGTDILIKEEDAERVVTRQKAAGYEFIKVYSNLGLEAFDAIANAAKSNGLPFAGHIPAAVPTDHAMRSGMQTAEHLIGISKATFVDGLTPVRRFDPAFDEFASRFGRGEVDVDDVFDQRKLDSLANRAAESGIWTVPTLTVLRGQSLSPAAMGREWQRPEIRYTDSAVKEFWRQAMVGNRERTDDFYRGVDRIFEHELAQVKAFHDAGARILAGTDAPNPFVYVGFSIVDELELFARAGLTAYEALQTATTNVAEFLGETGETGVVAEGARADLVLLEKNPLQDVGAYRDIVGVMVAGHWLDRAGLDTRLAGVVTHNEQEASVINRFSDWPTEAGEQVLFSAVFSISEDGRDTGAERIAPVQSSNDSRTILGQRLGNDGTMRAYRLEFDAAGNVQRLVQREQPGGAPRETLIVKEDDGYRVMSPDGQQSKTYGPAGVILTNTALDWLTLYPALAPMKDGETRQIAAWGLNQYGKLEEQTVTVTRHPSEVIIGHFYFSGVNLHEVAVETVSGATNLRVWMGGGFYAGWPVKIVVEPVAGGSTMIDYKRIL